MIERPHEWEPEHPDRNGNDSNDEPDQYHRPENLAGCGGLDRFQVTKGGGDR